MRLASPMTSDKTRALLRGECCAMRATLLLATLMLARQADALTLASVRATGVVQPLRFRPAASALRACAETPPPPPRRPLPPEPPPPPQERDLFIPILVGVSFGGYALIVLYDVFFGNGLCGLTIECANTPFSW